ncbi:hypothetical protein J6O86_08640 [bacterium]|nr:hypothetical protein [bacterium]
MKNLLYLLTMLFNALGFLFSLSLVFYINLDNILFLPIIALSCFIFGISFALTTADFIHSKNSARQKRLSHYVPQNNKVVIDYKDYFISQKSDFIIS